MKLERIEPPRRFRAGGVEISHCASVEPAADEQLTFRAPSGSELDVVRKSWGYYATPSLNRRLTGHGLRGLLALSETHRLYLLLVETGAEDEFEAYLAEQRLRVLTWLDDDAAVDALVERLDGER